MNGYDFDKTIYSADSTTNFFLYMVFRRPYLLIFAPWFILATIAYGLKLVGKKRYKQCMFFFVPWHKNIEKIVNKFWDKNIKKVMPWYLEKQKEDDIVISASLEFIIKPAMKKLGIKKYYATKFNVKTGKIEGENCYGEEKCKRFNRDFAGTRLQAFYSDSMSDKPMFNLAENAYLVKKGKIIKIDNK